MTDFLTELAEQIDGEIANLERVVRDAEEGWQKFISSGDRLYLISVAFNLHGFYTGVEQLFEDITTFFNEKMPRSETWHKGLLLQVATEIPELRPAVISQRSRDALDEYRKFRHLVRNIYPFQLEAARIQPLVESATNILALFKSDLLEFTKFLENQAGADPQA